MRQLKIIANLIAISLFIFTTSCADNEAGMACDSDSECPASHYCAKSGGVLFSSSSCVKRSSKFDDEETVDAAASHDIETQPEKDSDLPTDVNLNKDQDSALDLDTDSTSDANIDSDTNVESDTSVEPDTNAEPDIETPPECVNDSECDDGISCTQSSCVEGTCQHAPDHSICDDDNICTDNHCDQTLGCVTKNNNASCDDGVFCNGTDLCSEGACTFHSGSPCTGNFCNENRKDCSECIADGECGQPTETKVGSCNFDTQCTASGTQNYLVRTPQCKNNSCSFSEKTINRPCSRAMPTESCGPRTESPWGVCTIGTQSTCALKGTQTRTITTSACNNQQCKETAVVETRNCDLKVPDQCAPEKKSWGHCIGFDDCSTVGRQSMSVTKYLCNSGECVPKTIHDVDARPCSRDTNGHFCSQGAYNGTCINGCCDTPCPPGKNCLVCLLE